MHVTYSPFRLRKRNKDLWTLHSQASKMVYSFCWFELPWLIAGPINPCKYFPVTCIINFKFRFFFFFKIHYCLNYAGFRWEGHIWYLNAKLIAQLECLSTIVCFIRVVNEDQDICCCLHISPFVSLDNWCCTVLWSIIVEVLY